MSLLGDNNINIYTIFSIFCFPQKQKQGSTKNKILFTESDRQTNVACHVMGMI